MNKIDSNPVPVLGRSFSFGDSALDAEFGAGLPVAALHEIHAAKSRDYGTAAAFALLAAERARTASKPILWISERRSSYRLGRLYPPAIMELGIDPDEIIHAAAPDPVTALRVAADAGRSGAMGAVILSLSGKNPRGLNMIATRRLALFARESKVALFLLREGASAMPSAAYSRWKIASLPSLPLEANAPGQPVFDVTLLRHRRGIDGLSARLEWNRENRKFAAHIGAVPAVSGIRKDIAGTDIEEERRRA